MKSKLATVGVTCDCKGSQLLKGEAKFEKEEDKAGQKKSRGPTRGVLSPLWTISQYFPIFQYISHIYHGTFSAASEC